MKFGEIPYMQPDLNEIKEKMSEFTKALANAKDYASAKEVFLETEMLIKHVHTLTSLASIRHSIDTRDKFYDDEAKFWDKASPELQEYMQEWSSVLLDSDFRKDFEEEYGDISFVNAEISLKTFSPEIIPDMQKENALVMEYEDLLASAKVPFEGEVYTIPQMTLFKTDPDDLKRLAAWRAEGRWYKDNQDRLDSIYDELVKLRDSMGKKLGYEGFTTLGYYRMQRNCYSKEDVEKFRAAVRKYLVPVADRIYRSQAKRLGKEYPMSFADNALEFRSGNPRPKGKAEDILAAGKKFYDELSPETSEFFNMMLEGDLLDVQSKEGKQGGGYCSGLPDYGVPFIFANFNGTQGDVEVVTHEAGHAFASYINRERIPVSTMLPSMEGCEVHSMSMEFMAWPWSKDFFGADAEKFHYSHLTSALTFIPYGTMVDHFQHEVYERPEMSPKERHAVWKNLLNEYMPWMKLDGEIPFYSEGEGWQRQHHIYSFPFYYIDYCLAQTVSLEFWAIMAGDGGDFSSGAAPGQKEAWEKYLAYTVQGGSRTFTDLLKNAGLKSPFEEETLKEVCAKAQRWLNNFDMDKIK